jgi:hypothetical protein|tara:strand:+ start:921 stop:1253 length:333 start_codon:yes stop_codon:yes gene_type:complete
MKKYINPNTNPAPIPQFAHWSALLLASTAPSISPAWIFPFTDEAFTIDTIPNGKQQNNVTNIALVKWLSTFLVFVETCDSLFRFDPHESQKLALSDISLPHFEQKAILFS